MKVVLDSLAWLDRRDLTPEFQAKIREALTIQATSFDGKEVKELRLYLETATHLGVAREFYLSRRKPHHEVEDRTSWGSPLPSALRFAGTLREEQSRALEVVHGALTGGAYGGALIAPPGWGKTVWTCALLAKLGVPTLVVLHKDFLVSQWIERIGQYLPGALVGRVQGDECNFEGKHVVVAMMQSLASRAYPPALYRWPGLVVVDELHRLSAATWAPVPMKFPSRYRVGLTATYRRKDGTEGVFLEHVGAPLFTAKEQRMTPGVRYVFTGYSLNARERLHMNLSGRSLLINLMVANEGRNRVIFDQLVAAVQTGRKVLVLSERLEHLHALYRLLREDWPSGSAPPSVGYYIGGMKQPERESAAKCQVVLATAQIAQEGLDIPALDTLFLTTPLTDVEQAVGRILRPHPSKRAPVVVDFRDDLVGMFRDEAKARQAIYARLGAS